MAEGLWAELAGLKDAELQHLVASLPATVLHSRADSTVGKYGQAFQRWKSWAKSYDMVTVFAVNEVYLAPYFQHLGEKLHSSSAVQEAVNMIGWIYQWSGLDPVTQSPLVQAILAGLKRIMAKHKVKKVPVTVDMLTTLLDSLEENSSLSDICLAASCCWLLQHFCAMMKSA